jgi:hypothetical protein
MIQSLTRHVLLLLSLHAVGSSSAGQSDGSSRNQYQQQRASHPDILYPQSSSNNLKDDDNSSKSIAPKDYSRQESRLPPPPPPPPPAYSNYNPIHYSFQQQPSKPTRIEDESIDIDADNFPVTFRPDHHDTYQSSSSLLPMYSSPRRDAITLQLSTRRGRVTLHSSCLLIGLGLGLVTSQSLLLKQNLAVIVLLGVACLIISYLRNPYGELMRALGLALLWTLQRSQRVRKTYPTMPYLKASFRLQPRVGFPVRVNKGSNDLGVSLNDNDDDEDDVEFNQLYTLIAMTFVGATCGGSLPLLPTWMGALAGAGTLGIATTLENARGDLARVMGARVVALMSAMLTINSELQVLTKLGVVSGKVFNKLLILDRKHNVRNRIISGFNFVSTQVANAMNNGGPSSLDDDERDRSRQSNDGMDRRRRMDMRGNGESRDIDRESASNSRW